MQTSDVEYLLTQIRFVGILKRSLIVGLQVLYNFVCGMLIKFLVLMNRELISQANSANSYKMLG